MQSATSSELTQSSSRRAIRVTPQQPHLLQRQCACGNSAGLTGTCSECQQKRLQRREIASSEQSEVPPIVHEVLRSPGHPLDATTQTLMQSKFDQDLSSVRVHTDSRAATSAQAVDASAYTVGNQIVFGAGQYAPRTGAGQQLLAHELTHVMQQRFAIGSTGPLRIGPANDRLEQQADQMAAQPTSIDQPSLQRRRMQTIPGISTPQPAGTRVRQDGSVSYTVNGVRVTFLPDIDDPSIGDRAETSIRFNDYEISAETRGDRVSSFTGPGGVEATIQTVYGREMSATSTSAYGRGTTAADQTAGNTSLEFHEGNHGLDFVQFIRTHRFPRFQGRRGMAAERFQEAMDQYNTAREQYQQNLDRFSEQRTDCVGTTIDQHQRSQGVTSSICARTP